MEDKAMVIGVLWVPKGAAKKIPKEYDLDEEEIEEMKQELAREEDEDGEAVPGFSEASNKQDMEYIETNFEKDFVDVEEFSEEEKEDYTIKKSDGVIVGAKIEKGYSCLEVCIYEEQKCNLFQHHEIGLSAFPLCMEWLGVNPKSFAEEAAKSGNYAIVGSFLPEIEVWDLDVVNNVMPKITLGGSVAQNYGKSKKSKLKGKKTQELKEGSHSDAVIALSLNQFRKNILCSGSADQTIKLWDLSNQKCVHTYNNHSDKVQCVKWNSQNESQLASAGFDRQLQIFDARYQNTALNMKLNCDPESMIWCPFDQNIVICTEEDGSLSGFDLRKNGQPLFQQKAHTKSASSVTASNGVPGLMVTTGLDGVIKVWDYQSIVNGEVKLVGFRNIVKQAKKLYCAQFYVDSPFLVGCGTNCGEMLIWDTSENVGVAKNFLERAPEPQKKDIQQYLENLKLEQTMEMEDN